MPGLFNALNYLVPASGSVHAYDFVDNFAANPVIDFSWDLKSLDAQQFIPSGVFIDNSQGTGPLTITIKQIDYTIVCPAGAQKQVQYPAPIAQTISIEATGTGQAVVIFVDFPVIPFAFDGVGGTQSVIIVDGFDTAGDELPTGFGTLPQTLNYAGAFIDNIIVTDGVDTWTQTFTNDGTNITAISGWVKS